MFAFSIEWFVVCAFWHYKNWGWLWCQFPTFCSHFFAFWMDLVVNNDITVTCSILVNFLPPHTLFEKQIEDPTIRSAQKGWKTRFQRLWMQLPLSECAKTSLMTPWISWRWRKRDLRIWSSIGGAMLKIHVKLHLCSPIQVQLSAWHVFSTYLHQYCSKSLALFCIVHN